MRAIKATREDRKGPKVRDVMRASATICHPWESLAIAAERMQQSGCGWLPVVMESGRVVGILTARDACLAAVARDLPLGEVSVEGAMRADVHACHPGDALANVLVAMQSYRVRRMPVVDADEKLVGVVGTSDVARRAEGALGPELVRTLAAIHEARSAVSLV